MSDDLETEARGGSASIPASQDDQSEALDDDKLGGTYPPDQPVGVDEYGITDQEQRIDEPIAERVLREEPELDGIPDAERAGRLVAPDEGIEADDEAAAVASSVDDLSRGDLSADDIASGDTTTRDTATELATDLSAEEAAVHVVAEDGDGLG